MMTPSQMGRPLGRPFVDRASLGLGLMQVIWHYRDTDLTSEHQNSLKGKRHMVMQHVLPGLAHHQFGYDDNYSPFRKKIGKVVNIANHGPQYRAILGANADELNGGIGRPFLPALGDQFFTLRRCGNV